MFRSRDSLRLGLLWALVALTLQVIAAPAHALQDLPQDMSNPFVALTQLCEPAAEDEIDEGENCPTCLTMDGWAASALGHMQAAAGETHQPSHRAFGVSLHLAHQPARGPPSLL